MFDLSEVWRTPGYGYHEAARAFLRVELVDPAMAEHAWQLFNGGLVSARLPRCQPYEVHFPYLLQFKVDHNLLGMDYARLGHACLRGEPPETSAAMPLPWARDGEVVGMRVVGYFVGSAVLGATVGDFVGEGALFHAQGKTNAVFLNNGVGEVAKGFLSGLPAAPGFAQAR